MRKIVALMSLFTFTFILAGCNIVSDSNENTETVSITQSVSHQSSREDENPTKGEVTEQVPVNPKKIAIFDFAFLDIIDFIGLEELGIEEITIVKSNVPAYLADYNNDSVGNAGTLFEPDFDALDLFQPDLVVISSRSAWAYDSIKSELGGVAVLNFAVDNTNYLASVERNFANLKQIFDGNTIFDDMIETIQTEIDEKNTLASASELNAIIIMTNGDDISGYGVGSRFSFIHNELGFVAADDAFGNGDANSHGDTISFEYVQTLNPDIIFVVDRSQAIGGEPSIGILDNALVNSTNAAQNDRVIALDSVAWYIVSGGYQSTLQMISDVAVLFE